MTISYNGNVSADDDIALCRLYQRDRRNEALIGQGDSIDVVLMTQIADPINARILLLHSVHPRFLI